MRPVRCADIEALDTAVEEVRRDEIAKWKPAEVMLLTGAEGRVRCQQLFRLLAHRGTEALDREEFLGGLAGLEEAKETVSALRDARTTLLGILSSRREA